MFGIDARLFIDGERVSIAQFLQNKNQNSNLDSLFSQIGGGVEGEEEASAPAGEAPITLKVKDQTGEEMFFKVKKGTEMSKIFNAYAGRRGVAVNTLRFMLDERRLQSTDTPKMLEMEEDDQIDVYLEQQGGGVEVLYIFYVSVNFELFFRTVMRCLLQVAQRLQSR
jgi:small ubiquitin-related modifier